MEFNKEQIQEAIETLKIKIRVRQGLITEAILVDQDELSATVSRTAIENYTKRISELEIMMEGAK